MQLTGAAGLYKILYWAGGAGCLADKSVKTNRGFEQPSKPPTCQSTLIVRAWVGGIAAVHVPAWLGSLIKAAVVAASKRGTPPISFQAIPSTGP